LQLRHGNTKLQLRKKVTVILADNSSQKVKPRLNNVCPSLKDTKFLTKNTLARNNKQMIRNANIISHWTLLHLL